MTAPEWRDRRHETRRMSGIDIFKHSKEAFDVDAGHVLFAEGARGDRMYAFLLLSRNYAKSEPPSTFTLAPVM